LLQFLTLCQILRVELQSIQAAPAAITIAEFTLLQQKLQFAQERLEMVQSHAQNQLKTAEDLSLAAQKEVLRLQVLQCSSPCLMVVFDANVQAELLNATGSLVSAQSQNQLLEQEILLVKDELKSSVAAASSAAVSLAASEVRVKKLDATLEEQRAAHLMELRQIREEQYVHGSIICMLVALMMFAQHCFARVCL
jgi:hypothetical protein